MPVESIPPQFAAGGGMPSPRKLRLARARMASATWNVALTMIVPMAFGMMCRMIIRRRDPPIIQTAST